MSKWKKFTVFYIWLPKPYVIKYLNVDDLIFDDTILKNGMLQKYVEPMGENNCIIILNY